MKMSVLKPFKRTARQRADGSYRSQCGYVKHSQFAAAPAHYVRAFAILQKDLLELFDYVEPADINKSCYSYRIHELHTRACIEVEANCRAILSENGYARAGDWNMSDYKKLEPTHHLSSFQVRLPIWHGSDNPRTPFEEWKTGQRLPWYQAYNNVKHSRHENFDQSNFRNMLDAMCGLVAILAAQFIVIDFGPESFAGEDALSKGMIWQLGGTLKSNFPMIGPPMKDMISIGVRFGTIQIQFRHLTFDYTSEDDYDFTSV